MTKKQRNNKKILFRWWNRIFLEFVQINHVQGRKKLAHSAFYPKKLCRENLKIDDRKDV